jgi:hypothetical protein
LGCLGADVAESDTNATKTERIIFFIFRFSVLLFHK